MSPSDVLTALTSLLKTKRPLYLWSAPGCGKSSIVRQAAASQGLELIDLRATLLDPVDLRGLPTIMSGKTMWAPPSFLPVEGEGVLFLDELSAAVPNVQTSLLQLTLDRCLGEYQLPDGWTVVAASNRVEDRAGAHRLVSSLANRFAHIDLEVSADDWHAWAVTAGIAPEVTAFIRFRPALLFNFDATMNPRAFASPRSWHFVSDLLPHTPANLVQRVVAGCVGDGPAAEFEGFLRLYQQLPDIDSVLKTPSTAPVPREPAVLYALVGALVERVRAKVAPAAHFVKYALRLPAEFSALALRDAVSLDRNLAADPAVQAWIRDARAKGLFVAAA